MTKQTEARFLSKTRKTASGCWEWTSAFTTNGYGAFFFDGKKVKAHRFSWELHKGKIPKGLYVCHTCDNRKCVNPAHLWLGSALENTKDCLSKNRHRIFTAAKLTPEKVLQIRSRKANGERAEDLAKEFGVHGTTICAAVRGECWGKRSMKLYSAAIEGRKPQ